MKFHYSYTIMATKSVPGHWTRGKEYIAMYETEAGDQGWFTTDDSGAIHWLSPWDDKDHRNIYAEPYILSTFKVIKGV